MNRDQGLSPEEMFMGRAMWRMHRAHPGLHQPALRLPESALPTEQEVLEVLMTPNDDNSPRQERMKGQQD